MRYVSFALLFASSCALASCNGGQGSSSAFPAPMHVVGQSTRKTASNVTGTAYAALVTAANPIAYYRLNDSGSKMMDSGAKHLDGIFGVNVKHGGSALTSDSGAQSSLFPGSAPGSDIASNTGTVITNPLFAAAAKTLTVEAWIKPNALNLTNHYVPLVSYGREAQGQAWVLQLSPQSTLNFWLKTTGGTAPFYSVKSNTILAASQAYQVVATYDSISAKIYVNGQLQTTVAASGTLDYSGLLPQWGLGIGGALGGAEPIMNGAISDVSIYTTALSAADVLTHYLVGAVNSAPPTPAPTNNPNTSYAATVAASHPLAYYKLNDTTSTMTDSGVNGLNGIYGANVGHQGAALTSAQDPSSVFPGSPAGSDIPSNSGTVTANSLFATASSGLTVEAWIKPADLNRTNNFMPIVSYGAGAIGNAWAIQVTPESSLDFYMKVTGGLGSYELKPAAARLTAAQIYQIVATYDGTNAKLYVNGSIMASVPASTPINYAGIPAQFGLSIGGDLDTSRPIFNGSINDVSIYPTALSPVDVENHYLVGHLAQTLVETPTGSDAFVDSIGVVTHLRATGTPYTDSWSTFETLLKASGIRHIGDALIATPAWYPPRVNELATTGGIHASLITGLTQTSQDIMATIPLFANSIESVGGPNEPDLTDGVNWVADTRNFQQMLWSTIKGTPATANLGVIGPSVLSTNHDLALGDLSGYMDSGSIHDYFSGYNPGTTGWGSLDQYGIYGSISWDRNICAIVSGTKPEDSTETGYSSSLTNFGGVDSRTLARYIPRLYLEHFLHGIDRTTLYEFYDDAANTTFSQFGLVDINNRPKSSYYAVKSLIAALADPGSVFATKQLSYVLTGDINNLQHLLLQKRDGTYELILWLEVESFDPVAKTDIAVPAQTVTLQPASLPLSASVSTIGDAGTITTNSLSFPAGVASISVDDHVTVVSFR